MNNDDEYVKVDGYRTLADAAMDINEFETSLPKANEALRKAKNLVSKQQGEIYGLRNRVDGLQSDLRTGSYLFSAGVFAVIMAALLGLAVLRIGWLWSAHTWPDRCEQAPIKVTTDPKALEQPK